MIARTPAQVLAQAASTLVGEHDVTDALARLVQDLADVSGAQAVAIVVLVEGDRLELLTSTSHRVAELEIFQVTHDEGPCIEAVRGGTEVSLEGEGAMLRRWPLVGRAIVDAGFAGVHAFPMQWHGQVLGGLNVFSSLPTALDESATRLGQAVADVATLLIVQERHMSPNTIAERIRDTLRGRVQIERAKGVVAYRENVDMARAYEILLDRSTATGRSLTETAREILDETRNHGPGPDEAVS
jgi:hypothetical protein